MKGKIGNKKNDKKRADVDGQEKKFREWGEDSRRGED